jgi:hypothetical protein
MLAGIRADSGPGPAGPANLPHRDQATAQTAAAAAPTLPGLWVGRLAAFCDAEHPFRNWKVPGSNSSSGSNRRSESFSGIADGTAAAGGHFLWVGSWRRRHAHPASLPRSPPDRFIARRWASFVDPLRAKEEDGRLGRPSGAGAHSRIPRKPTCGYAALKEPRVSEGGCWSAVSGRGRPPSPWPGHKPGSGSAAPRPAGPAGWPGSGAADRRCRARRPDPPATGPAHPAAGHSADAHRSRPPAQPGRRSPPGPEPGQRPNRLTLAALLAAQLQLGAVADGACGGPASWWRRCSSTCRRGNRSDAAKLVRSGCSLQPPRLLGVVGGPAARLGGAVAVALVGGAVAQVGIAVTVVGGAIAHIRGPLAGVGGACSASRARASAARTRASSGALAATRSRCTSWTTSWATSASLREDARARPRSCWNASSRVTPWVAATIPLACSIHTRLASAYRS